MPNLDFSVIWIDGIMSLKAMYNRNPATPPYMYPIGRFISEPNWYVITAPIIVMDEAPTFLNIVCRFVKPLRICIANSPTSCGKS